MVVDQIRRFAVGRFAQLILIRPVVAFLAGRVAVLLEQTGNFELLPERREMLELFLTERTNAFRTQDEAGDFLQGADKRI